MAVCALTMLDGMGGEATAVGGALLVALALVLAWLSTHVAERGDHILGTILSAGAHASLIGVAGDAGGDVQVDAPEQTGAAPPSPENKPDDGGGGGETDEVASPEDTDLLLDIQSKAPPGGRIHASDEEEDEDYGEEEERVRGYKKDMSTTPSFCVRLKFLNDTEEVAVVKPHHTVDQLKSKYFSGREHQIKLIYQGQLLQDSKRTLLSLNVTHNSVIHCHVSQAPHDGSPEAGAAGSPQGAPAVSGGLRAAGVAVSTGSLVVPVFVVILAVVWYFRINYRQFFTAPATISLVGVTIFFSFLIFGMHGR